MSSAQKTLCQSSILVKTILPLSDIMPQIKFHLLKVHLVRFGNFGFFVKTCGEQLIHSRLSWRALADNQLWMPRELYFAVRAVWHRFVPAQNNNYSLECCDQLKKDREFHIFNKEENKEWKWIWFKRTTQLFTKGVLTEKFRTEEFDFQSCESYFDIK